MGAGLGWEGALVCGVRLEREDEVVLDGAGLRPEVELLFCAFAAEGLPGAALTGFFFAEVELLEDDDRVSLLGMGVEENPFKHNQSVGIAVAGLLGGHYSTYGLIHWFVPREIPPGGVQG